MKRRGSLKVAGGVVVRGMTFAGLFDTWASAAKAKAVAVPGLLVSDYITMLPVLTGRSRPEAPTRNP
jgi:hypothetical protein